MEERIQQLQEYFQKDYKEFIQSFSSSPLVTVKEEVKQIIKSEETKPIPKNAHLHSVECSTSNKVIDAVISNNSRSSGREHPLMMNKINKYKKDLSKNNLKKQQKAFVSDGTIDDFEKELGLKSI